MPTGSHHPAPIEECPAPDGQCVLVIRLDERVLALEKLIARQEAIVGRIDRWRSMIIGAGLVLGPVAGVAGGLVARLL